MNLGPIRGDGMTDGDLVRQALSGRSEAYEELVRRWGGRITALCHAKVGCASAADDLAQESLWRGYRALATLAEPEKFGAWLCTIARNACVNWLKAKERSPIPFSMLPANQEDFTKNQANMNEPSLEREEELGRLMAEVARLPEEYREVLTLYYHHDDLAYRDLARILGVSAATINARLTKARALLRERLGVSRS